MIHSTEIKTRQIMRDKINEDVERFLASGGKIYQAGQCEHQGNQKGGSRTISHRAKATKAKARPEPA